ncbi:hypothetical protein JRO89_XS08G0171700 [Xanthoceras sorbifolium]|uniref:Uncharacterized protein n=1 Tax=Xanthoceras sorbifolium TaxID=99658 RepID=A0ABQ8HQ71_9ROSI|nr:hypothetical protein JRO89_XS08G0171700 [Xanthoceras sorbifolium]
MSDREDYDSDAPEEFTAEQGIQQDEEIRKVQKESKARVVREGKERRRLWAQRKTPRPSKGGERKEGEGTQDVAEAEPEEESTANGGMLPSEIVELLAAREKYVASHSVFVVCTYSFKILTKWSSLIYRQVFLSDSEDEKAEVKHTPRKKKKKSSGLETVILNDMPPPECLKNSLEFLKKRKMQVSRSSAVLNNSNQALRFLSTSGLLK